MLKQNQNRKIIISKVKGQDGFSHLFIPVVIVVALGVGGVAELVVRANHKTPKQSVSLTASQSTQAKTINGTSSNTSVPTSKPLTTAQANTPVSSLTKTSTTKTTTTTTTPTNPAPNSTSQTQTPLSALTAIITNLDNGIAAQVTAASVTIPGPIGNATGTPIVFSVNGQTYYAYRQEQRPDFSTSASQTAGTMAIVSTSQSTSTVSAYLDKGNILVNPDQQAVGYSTGGN